MNLSETVLGIELGSTRIKSVLLDRNHKPIATGSFEWENKLINGIWTYSMEDVDKGIKTCFSELKKDFKNTFGMDLTKVGAIGISGMMHGYLVLDKNGELLTEFRTWRNTITEKAAEKLTEYLNFNIPQRWSVAHLYQAILNKEAHLSNIDYITTLAGYIHLKLTGKKVIGVGEASGKFPIDPKTLDYNQEMVDKFDKLIENENLPWKFRDIFPKVLNAGENAGILTEEGAKYLDISGTFESGIPLAPPEGDAGTGMVATNSVRLGTGNVSAGTSGFTMIVTDKKLSVHREIDMITTPAGKTVAMVHCNNCTSDINAWVNLFYEFAKATGSNISKGELFTTLFNKALEGDADCGGLMSYNYISGEGITNVNEGRPVFLRKENAVFSLANFMRTHLYSAIATLQLGMNILVNEGVKIDKLYGHGGYFKTPGVGQKILSAAVGCPISVLETAGEGGPYGMALLAAYMLWKDSDEELEDYLDNKVFNDSVSHTEMATDDEICGFKEFLKDYKNAFSVEKEAILNL